MIKVDDLSYSVPFGDIILREISFEVGPGEFLGVLGRNGVGKTTLIDILMGFRKATSGSVRIFDTDPMSLIRGHSCKVTYLSQEVILKRDITIDQFLSFHALCYPTYSKSEEKRLISYFSLDPKIKIGALSTGQQRKVQIVAALASEPELILIDEITAVLDPEARSLDCGRWTGHFWSEDKNGLTAIC